MVVEVVISIRERGPHTSLYRQPLYTFKNAATWEYWMRWLKDRNLQSAISGYQNLPHWVTQEEVSNRSYIHEEIH